MQTNEAKPHIFNLSVSKPLQLSTGSFGGIVRQDHSVNSPTNSVAKYVTNSIVIMW